MSFDMREIIVEGVTTRIMVWIMLGLMGTRSAEWEK